jgi:hypothetical protein
MKICMQHTRRGSEDGFAVRLYERGQVYEVSELLGSVFVFRRDAVIVNPHPTEDEDEPLPTPLADAKQ